MASVVIDKTLEFTFPDTWLHCNYEKSTTRTAIQKNVSSICCVDLLLLDTSSKRLYLIESKDFGSTAGNTKESSYIRGELTDHFARKFIHSIAGLTCAKLCGDDELKLFYRALLSPSIKKILVSFVELGSLRNSRVQPNSSLVANLTQKMRTVLRPICCQKGFHDTLTIPVSYGWTVSRVPTP